VRVCDDCKDEIKRSQGVELCHSCHKKLLAVKRAWDAAKERKKKKEKRLFDFDFTGDISDRQMGELR